MLSTDIAFTKTWTRGSKHRVPPYLGSTTSGNAYPFHSVGRRCVLWRRRRRGSSFSGSQARSQHPSFPVDSLNPPHRPRLSGPTAINGRTDTGTAYARRCGLANSSDSDLRRRALHIRVIQSPTAAQSSRLGLLPWRTVSKQQVHFAYDLHLESAPAPRWHSPPGRPSTVPRMYR